MRATGNINLNESVVATRTASLEAGGSILDNNDAQALDVRAQNVVLFANGDIGTAANPLDYQATNLAARSVTGGVFLDGLADTVTIGQLNTLKGNVLVTGVQAATTVCIDQFVGGIIVDQPIVAGDVVALQAAGDILLNGSVKATNKASLRSVTGSILDNGDEAVDVEAQAVVMAAQGDVGRIDNTIDIKGQQVATRAQNGQVGITSTGGNLQVTTIALEKAGGTVTGVQAGTDLRLGLTDGNIVIESEIVAGQTVRIVADNGSILDGNGPANNVRSGGNASLEACKGFIGSAADPLDVIVGGNLFVDARFSDLAGTVAGSILVGECPDNPYNPGFFNGAPIGGRVPNQAFYQNNIFQGENRQKYPFMYTGMFNFIDSIVDQPVLVRYIQDDYNFLDDLEFLLRKKAEGEAFDFDSPELPSRVGQR
jgi:hypothetical protein